MKFDHKNCNGWVVIAPTDVDGGDPVNYHVVEVVVARENGKITSVLRNDDNVTMCGDLKVKPGRHASVVLRETAEEMRSVVAELHNSGKQICGRCVARFYADSNDSIGNEGPNEC